MHRIYRYTVVTLAITATCRVHRAGAARHYTLPQLISAVLHKWLRTPLFRARKTLSREWRVLICCVNIQVEVFTKFIKSKIRYFRFEYVYSRI